MRLINADALKKAFEETVVIEPMPYAFVKQIIDNSPTVCERYRSFCMVKPERPQGDFTRNELQSWLYAIAINNTDNELGRSCEEIIIRLDGFERYVSDMRERGEEA